MRRAAQLAGVYLLRASRWRAPRSPARSAARRTFDFSTPCWTPSPRPQRRADLRVQSGPVPILQSVADPDALDPARGARCLPTSRRCCIDRGLRRVSAATAYGPRDSLGLARKHSNVAVPRIAFVRPAAYQPGCRVRLRDRRPEAIVAGQQAHCRSKRRPTVSRGCKAIASLGRRGDEAASPATHHATVKPKRARSPKAGAAWAEISAAANAGLTVAAAWLSADGRLPPSSRANARVFVRPFAGDGVRATIRERRVKSRVPGLRAGLDQPTPAGRGTPGQRDQPVQRVRRRRAPPDRTVGTRRVPPRRGRDDPFKSEAD